MAMLFYSLIESPTYLEYPYIPLLLPCTYRYLSNERERRARDFIDINVILSPIRIYIQNSVHSSTRLYYFMPLSSVQYWKAVL